MAYSRVTKIGDGVTTQFTVNFSLGYLDSSHITARVGTEVDGLGDPVYRTITFLSTNLLQISGPPAGIGVKILFERTIKKDELIVNFNNGDVMDEVNLDTAQKQTMMAVQEVLDGRFSTLTQDLDFGDFTGVNTRSPTAPGDLANKAYVDNSTNQLISIAVDIAAVSAISASVTQVAAIDSEVSTVAGLSSDISLLAANNAILTGTASALYMAEDTFVGDGSTTSWPLSGDPVAKENLDVWVGGAIQTVGDYSLTGSTNLVLTPAVAVGIPIIARMRVQSASAGVFTGNASNLTSGILHTDRLASGSLTNTKFADMSQATIKGRAAGSGVGPPADLTGSQIVAVISSEASGLSGNFTANSDFDYTLGSGSGYFSDYNCKAKVSLKFSQNENLSAVGESGAFRDALAVQHIDLDDVAYSGTSRLTASYAFRALVNGSFNAQEKDLVAGQFTSIGRIEWANRGVSGLNVDAIQYGRGIASNEFIVEQPSTANTLSESMAAVQAVVRQRKGASGGGNLARCVLAQNDRGYAITAAFQGLSTTGGGATDGSFNLGLDLSGTVVNAAALSLRGSGNGSTVIEYDLNDYTAYDRTNNVFNFAIGGAVPFSINGAGAKLATYAVAGVPAANVDNTGTLVYIWNESGGGVPAFSDGTSWRRVTDRSVIS